MTLKFTIEEDINTKKLISDEYNYVFNKSNMYLMRWGSTISENAPYSPFGPETIYIDINNMPITAYMYVLELVNTNKTVAQVVLEELPKENSIYPAAVVYAKENNITPNTYHINNTCEGALFSIYVNNNAIAYPCKCCENTAEGINLLEVDNFYNEVWCSEMFKTFRWKLLSSEKCLSEENK